jgi:uncharacterized protein YbjT (DUF2867 family)
MRVLVAGGTGQVGRGVVAALRARGHEAVVAARSTGVDLITGAGLSMAGVDAVLDTTNVVTPDDQEALDFFRTVSRNLLAAEAEAGVRHHVLLSIVGLDLVPDLGYYRAKIAQERTVLDAGVPYTIARATQFFEFLDTVLDRGTTDGVTRVSPILLQPIAVADLVPILADIVTGPPAGGIVDVAGPAPIGLDEIARRLGRRTETDPATPSFAGAGRDALIPAGHFPTRLGTTDLATWQRR